MTLPSCSACVVVLNQQREQDNYEQHQVQEEALAPKVHNSSDCCTVVENGRVVVKPIKPPKNETHEQP
jgi:hypothetical protein